MPDILQITTPTIPWAVNGILWCYFNNKNRWRWTVVVARVIIVASKLLIHFCLFSNEKKLNKTCSFHEDSGHCHWHKVATILTSDLLYSNCTVHFRGLQRDVVYLGWPIASSYMSPNAGSGTGVAGFQPMRRSPHRSLNKLCRSNSIFNLWNTLTRNALRTEFLTKKFGAS